MERCIASSSITSVARRPPPGRTAATLVALATLPIAIAATRPPAVAASDHTPPAGSAPDRSTERRATAVIAPADATAAPSPRGTLTLRDAYAASLAGSPALRSAAWNAGAEDGRRVQAGLLPNPTLIVESEDLAGSGDFSPGISQPQTTLSLSQLVEIGGDRAARTRIATLTADLAAWDYERARLELAARVARTFVDALESQEAVVLAEDAERLARDVASIVDERVSAGVEAPPEGTKAGVAVASAGIDLRAARRVVDIVYRELAATWGEADPHFERVAGELAPPTSVPSLETLRLQLAHAPALERWRTDLARRAAHHALELARGVPDLTLSAGYRRFHDTENDVLVVGASVPLPLFDRNQGSIAAADRELRAGVEAQRATETDATVALADAHRSLASSRDEVEAIDHIVLPAAGSAYEAVHEGYRSGKFALIDVLDAQRTLVGARTRRLRALSSFHRAAIEIERVLGKPLAELDGATATVPRDDRDHEETRP